MQLTIETDQLTVTLDGPERPSAWKSSEPGDPPLLSISRVSNVLLESVTWNDQSIHEPGSPSPHWTLEGPHLAEETSYKLTAIAKSGERIAVIHRDPSLIADVTAVRGRPDVLTGSINFRSQVGRTTFQIVSPTAELQFEIEVRPTKLNYENDYSDLLQEVSGLSRLLVLEYLRATSQGGHTKASEPNSSLEWLLLLREEIDGLDRALKHIESHPSAQLTRVEEHRPIERIRHLTPTTRRAIARGRGEGPWIASPGIPRHRTSVPASTALETLDTLEHRWLRHEIREATRALAELRLSFEAQRTRKTGQPSARDASVARELQAMEDLLAPHLHLSPLADAGNEPMRGFSSLMLQGRAGYREAYQALIRLRMTTHVGGAALNLPISDLADLYEVWCFICVVRLASRALGTTIKLEDLVEIQDSGIRLKLVPGRKGAVVLEAAGDLVKVSYNQDYRMLTGRQRPDIVIELRRGGLPPMILVLDAKYRLETSPEYVAAFGGPGPQADAVGQLHRYRDAITISTPTYGNGRPVVRAVALFPLGRADSDGWPRHRFFASIDEVGIGALPFLPSNIDWVDEWIRHSLNAPSSVVAWPGPPFLAWRALDQSHF